MRNLPLPRRILTLFLFKDCSVYRKCCFGTADRVKQIRTDAKINQMQTDKLIAALIAEKEKLLRDLDAANRSGADGLTNDGDLSSLL